MPIIEVSLKDLEKLIGKKLPRDEEGLDNVLQFAKAEVERLEGDNLAIKVEDGVRLDLWCVEGIARELKGALGIESRMAEYSVEKSEFEVFVDKKMKEIRPFIACAVVKGVKLNDRIIKQLMQQQEKIDGTYGRGRKKSSIGLYDFDKLVWPLKYTITKPNENAFVPLGFDKPLTPAEILEEHPKGREYGKLLDGFRNYPIFVDSEGKVLSFPPIINSENLGKITENTKNILVEVTGIDWRTVKAVLLVVALSLVDRGGKLYEVKINYPYKLPTGENVVKTPELFVETMEIKLKDIAKVLGFELGVEELEEILERGRYDAEIEGDIVRVYIPPYRADIMHPVDVIEDIAIMKGLNEIEPSVPEMPTIGALTKLDVITNRIREICIGFGCQEVLTFTLTNKNVLFKKMELEEGDVIEVENPVSSEYVCLRNWLLPNLFKVLSANKHRDYPQNIFEIGDCVIPDKNKENGTRQIRKLALVMCYDKANLTKIKSVVEGLLKNFGIEWELKEANHPSFINSRCANIKIRGKHAGIFGEIHPKVLSNWEIELPVVALELDLNSLKKF